MQKASNYSVSIPHFYCLEYSEEDRKMKIEIDFREKPIYLSTAMIISWENPNQEIVIDEDEKIRILNNIKRYLSEERGFSEVIIEC